MRGADKSALALRQGGINLEIYLAARSHSDVAADVPIATLFWGAVIFLALFIVCLLVRKAVERLRSRKK
jgi:hypothetical protein